MATQIITTTIVDSGANIDTVEAVKFAVDMTNLITKRYKNNSEVTTLDIVYGVNSISIVMI